MSVLIEGMAMPKCCDACSFACWSNLHQTGSCDLLNSKQCFDDYSTDYRTKRSEHCPLVEVPEPHGRLGDLDELYASIKKWLIQNRYNMTEATRVWICGVLEGIAAAPTIIPASEASEEGET